MPVTVLKEKRSWAASNLSRLGPGIGLTLGKQGH